MWRIWQTDLLLFVGIQQKIFRFEVQERIEEKGKVDAGYAALLREYAMEDMLFHENLGDPEMKFGGGRANGLHKEL